MSSIICRVDNIKKPSQDRRSYRGIELSNGLKIFLISDPTTDMAAASLNVGVGHLMDRWEFAGTAHFCEHMLFLGTDKYPVENEYKRFISTNSGNSNAFTTGDTTCYYFDISPSKDSFVGTLDRFVQFFISPQFTQSATEREVLAVDSEHAKNCKEDGRRLYQVMKFLSKPGHDFGKFGTGDKTTLKGPNLRQELLDFYSKWYSANIMSLVLVGKESLDELESYLTTLGFDQIPNKNVELRFWTEHPMGPEQLKKKISVVPIKEIRELRIFFNIPYLEKDYKAFPSYYITHLLNSKSKGSVYSELYRKGLLTYIRSDENHNCRGVASLYIGMTLTEEGLSRVDEILENLFQYIAMLKEQGVQRWIYEEIRQMGEIDFANRNKKRSVDIANSVSCLMAEVEMEDLLSYRIIVPEYRPDLIEAILNCLTPDNFQYFLFDKSLAGKEGNINEPIYGTEIKIESISEEELDRFRKALPNGVFHLPEKNPFIPSDFKLKEEPSKSEHPIVVLDTPWIRSWHKKDEEYLLPKACTTVQIYSPIIHQTPRNSALNSLLSKVYYYAIMGDIDIAATAGLFGYPSADEEKSTLTITCHGYNEKQSLFVEFLLRQLIEFVPDEQTFAISLNDLCREYRNKEHNEPIALTDECREHILYNKKWTNEQKLAEAANLTVKDLLAFCRELFTAFHVELLSYGNVTEAETIELSIKIVEILTKQSNIRYRPLFSNEFWRNREFELPTGNEILYQHWKNSHEVNCVTMFYQIGTTTTSNAAKRTFLIHLLREPAFYQLRTVETLGYIVHTEPMISNGVLWLYIRVQGSHSPSHVRKRILAFLETRREALDKMTEEEFNKQRESTIVRLLEEPKTLKDRDFIFFCTIKTKTYHFDKDADMANYLKGVTKEEMLHFFEKHILKERRMITIVVNSRADCEKGKVETSEETEYEEIECPYDLHNELRLLPHPRPMIDLPLLGLNSNGSSIYFDKAHI